MQFGAAQRDGGMASYSKTMFAPTSATQSDILTVWSYHADAIVPSYVTWEAWRSSQVADQDWQKQRDAVAFALDTPVSREIWKHARSQFHEGFSGEINAVPARRREQGLPDTSTMGALIEWQRP